MSRVTVCRICSGCASVDVPDYKNKGKFKMENLLIGRFMKQVTTGPTVTTRSTNDPLLDFGSFSACKESPGDSERVRTSPGTSSLIEKKMRENIRDLKGVHKKTLHYFGRP